jgi:hypothetical protein
VDAAGLRELFAKFIGADRYRRFIWQINRRDRLRAWQEDIWGRFMAANPELAVLSHDEIRAAFRVCEIHGDELQTYSTRVFRGNVDYAPDYDQAWSSLFPYSKRDFWSSEGTPYEGNTIELLYCPTCCLTQNKWEEGRTISNRPTTN